MRMSGEMGKGEERYWQVLRQGLGLGLGARVEMGRA